MCIIMRWSRNHSATWAERFRTSSLLCTYKLCDYYTPIPILSPFLFTPSLYAPILNLQDFSFTCDNLQLCTLVISLSQQCGASFKKSWMRRHLTIACLCLCVYSILESICTYMCNCCVCAATQILIHLLCLCAICKKLCRHMCLF